MEILQNPQENACTRFSFLITLQQACNLIKKETLLPLFSCEFFGNFKNIFLHRTFVVADSCVFVVNFKHIQYNIHTLLFLTLNLYLICVSYLICVFFQFNPFIPNATLPYLQKRSKHRKVLLRFCLMFSGGIEF